MDTVHDEHSCRHRRRWLGPRCRSDSEQDRHGECQPALEVTPGDMAVERHVEKRTTRVKSDITCQDRGPLRRRHVHRDVVTIVTKKVWIQISKDERLGCGCGLGAQV